MADPFDIMLNGEPYRLMPGGYQRSPETPLSATNERQSMASFGRGLLIAQDDETTDDQGGGWSGIGVRSVGGGAGIEPFPSIVNFNDSILDIPDIVTPRAHGAIAGSNAFIGIGRRIYKSVALSNGTWSALTAAADLGAGFTITGLAYVQDDLLVLLAGNNDIRKFNVASSSLTIWRTGEKGQLGVGYKGQLIYAPRAANNQEELRLSGTRWNGNAVTHFRYLDSPIVNMALFNAEVVIATKTSLYRMGGDPYPGEADDATVTNDTSKAAEWRGDPESLMSHGSFAAADDFVFLCSYRGRLYTWLSGHVVEYDGQDTWLPIGPEGVTCYGGVVADDWLVVALTARSGEHELWGFDGSGWWRFYTQAGAALVWPVPLGGAGNRDLAVFTDGSDNYDLVRLKWRSHSVNTYAASANWICPLLTGHDPGIDKAWRQVDVWFAWPEMPGNPASADTVTIALDFSINAGTTWTQIATASMTVGREQHLSHHFAVPPVSRLLQLRVRWNSVNDWAPILSHIDVDFTPLDSAPRRQQWTLELQVRDQLAGSGQPEIDALWDAWREVSVLFRDIDYETHPVERVVRVLEVQEASPGAAGADQEWSGGVVTVKLSEL